MSLPRYPEYKDSGVPWLGEVPGHWSVLPLARITEEKCDGPFGSGLKSDHYTDSGARVIRLQNIRSTGFFEGEPAYLGLEYFQTELSRHNVVPDDVLIAGLGDDNNLVGRACIAPAEVSPALVKADCFRFRIARTRANPKFVAAQLNVSAATDAGRLSTGTTRSRIPLSIMATRVLALPPLTEQTAIATFLDRETAKIDGLIAEQEKLIALLAEKRQATISHAVTKGLNPDAPVKDSGVEGLGNVPAHWTIISLARLASEKCDGPFGSGIKSEHYKDDGALVVRLQNIRAEGFFAGEAAYLDLDYFQNELLRHAVLPGDILVAGLGDDRNLVGRACVAPENLGPALVKADCFRFRLITNLSLADFIATQLSATAICDSGRLATGSTRSRIPLSTMAARKMAIPQIKEQADIVNFIKKENTKLDALTGEATRGIALLKERRSALISAAVTGRIDVRHSVGDTKGQRQDATI